MPLLDAKRHIAFVLRTIPGIKDGAGMVHAYERWERQPNVYLKFVKAPAANQLNVWFVKWVSARRRRENDGDKVVTVHEFAIEGYFAVHDPPNIDAAAEDAGSEPKFDALVETILEWFDKHDEAQGNTLGGTVVTSDPWQLSVRDEKLFGEVLCHHVRLTKTAKDWFRKAMNDRIS